MSILKRLFLDGRYLKSWALLLFAVVSGSGWADATDAFRERLAPLQDLQGTFSQVLSDDTGQTLQTSAGRFALKRPGYFLWESKAPYAQLVIGTPERIWVYDPDLEQVTISRREATDLNNPARLLTGDLSDLRARFEVASRSEADHTEFQLTPKQDSSPYRSVSISFQGKTLQQLSFVDKLNQRTLIRFSDVQLNQDLPAALFAFEPPPGTDVIEDD